MKEMINRIVEVLKEKVKDNLLQIQNNQKEIRNLLKQPVTADRSAELESKYAHNKLLLSENNDYINVQLTMTNFFEKYSSSDMFSVKQVAVVQSQYKNKRECFEATISNQIPFDENHPFFSDDRFFQKLLSHYQSIEDYEKCSKLMKEKKQHS